MWLLSWVLEVFMKDVYLAKRAIIVKPAVLGALLISTCTLYFVLGTNNVLLYKLPGPYDYDN